MKKYENPKIQVLEMTVEDVLTLSMQDAGRGMEQVWKVQSTQ